MRFKVLALTIVCFLSLPTFSQTQSVLDIDSVKHAAMKTVEIKVKNIVSSSIKQTMNGQFFQTYIERKNGQNFIVAHVNKHEGVIRTFNLPDKTEMLEDALIFLKKDYVMIENKDARQVLSALRMIYNIDTAFPMFVSRHQDRWILLIDNHDDKVSYIGFAITINAKGYINEIIYSNDMKVSEEQLLGVGEIN